MSVAGYNAVVFAGYGMAEGEDKMVSLIGDLMSSGNLKLLEDQGAPLSSGDVPIALNQTLFNPNPALQVSPFEHAGSGRSSPASTPTRRTSRVRRCGPCGTRSTPTGSRSV